MIISLLFSIAIAFPFMNWRHEPEGRLKKHHLVNVTIFMLQHPPPPEGLRYTFDVTKQLEEQGWDYRNSSLIHSAWKIYLVFLYLVYFIYLFLYLFIYLFIYLLSDVQNYGENLYHKDCSEQDNKAQYRDTNDCPSLHQTIQKVNAHVELRVELYATQ